MSRLRFADRAAALSPRSNALPTQSLQAELRRRQEAALRLEAQCVDREKMETLRKSFLEKVLSYSGVPYARRYHEATCESNNIVIAI